MIDRLWIPVMSAELPVYSYRRKQFWSRRMCEMTDVQIKTFIGL